MTDELKFEDDEKLTLVFALSTQIKHLAGVIEEGRGFPNDRMELMKAKDLKKRIEEHGSLETNQRVLEGGA